MRRTLPRLLARALAIPSFVLLAAAPVAAQGQVAAGVINIATVLPASMASTVLFPPAATVAAVANAAEAGVPLQIGQVAHYNGGPKRPTALPALYASTALLQVLDVKSTMTAVSLGAHEANPLMKGVASNQGAMLAVKAGVAGATIFMAEKMWKRNPMGAVAMMLVVNSVNAVVVAHNYKVAQSLR